MTGWLIVSHKRGARGDGYYGGQWNAKAHWFEHMTNVLDYLSAAVGRYDGFHIIECDYFKVDEVLSGLPAALDGMDDLRRELAARDVPDLPSAPPGDQLQRGGGLVQDPHPSP